MRKYDSYKPTKIEFLDEIPEHWEEKRMRFLGYLYGGLSGKSATDFNQLTNENNKYFIPFTNIANNFRIDPESLQTVVISENENQNTVQKGDLFFLMSSENYDDVGKSAVLLDDLEETYLNSFCKGFRITKDDIVPEFLNYQLHSKQLRHNLLTGANGFTRINLKIDKVIDLLTALPTPEEQTAIATYLDRKTADIDELIADKKRLLELYEEEKIAIINQAVTKGINPDVPMKDSGIEWLGEIPEHWYATSLKRLVETKITDGPHETPTFLLEGVPFVSAEAVKNGKIDFNYARGFISDEDDEKYSKKCKPKRNDIFIVKSGSTTGKIALVDFDANFNIWSPLALVRVNEKVDFMFMYYALQSTYFQDSIKLFWSYGTQPNIGMNVIENLKVTFAPDSIEQLQIVKHIEQTTMQIDNQISRIQKLIELLTEYRTALISEVVTGKIKVIE